MNFFNKAGRAVMATILGPCYSKGFVFEDAYQDDDIFDEEHCCFYNCGIPDDDNMSMESISDDFDTSRDISTKTFLF
jgi:hypothetical protein